VAHEALSDGELPAENYALAFAGPAWLWLAESSAECSVCYLQNIPIFTFAASVGVTGSRELSVQVTHHRPSDVGWVYLENLTRVLEGHGVISWTFAQNLSLNSAMVGIHTTPA
jgi:hypothetical protein